MKKLYVIRNDFGMYWVGGYGDSSRWSHHMNFIPMECRLPADMLWSVVLRDDECLVEYKEDG